MLPLRFPYKASRLLRAVAKRRLWMRELVAGDVADAEMVAAREEAEQTVCPDDAFPCLRGAGYHRGSSQRRPPQGNWSDPINGSAAAMVRSAQAAGAEGLKNPSPPEANRSPAPGAPGFRERLSKARRQMSPLGPFHDHKAARKPEFRHRMVPSLGNIGRTPTGPESARFEGGKWWCCQSSADRSPLAFPRK